MSAVLGLTNMHKAFWYSAELYDPRLEEWVDVEFRVEADGHRYTCDDHPGEVFYEVGHIGIVDVRVNGSDVSFSEGLYYKSMITNDLMEDIRIAADAVLNA